jgi:hypothetical protein
MRRSVRRLQGTATGTSRTAQAARICAPKGELKQMADMTKMMMRTHQQQTVARVVAVTTGMRRMNTWRPSKQVGGWVVWGSRQEVQVLSPEH